MNQKKAGEWAVLALKYYLTNPNLTNEEKDEIQESILLLTDEPIKKSSSRAVECPHCQSRNVFYLGDKYICMRCNSEFSKHSM